MFLQPTVHLQEATTTTVHLYCFLFRHLLSFSTMPLTKTKIQFLIFLIHGEWIVSNILHVNLIRVIYFVFWSVFCFYSESFQLQCHPQTITAHIGGEFVILCKYDTNLFLFSKKYWCQGESKFTCEILVDSDNHVRSKTGRVYVVDLRKSGLFVKVTGLRFEDTGKYWVGIDKIHADIMTPIKVVISEGENKTSQFSIILHLWSALQNVNVSLCQFQCLNPDFGPWTLWQTGQRAAVSQWLSAAGLRREPLSSTAGIKRATYTIARLIYSYTVASCFRTAIFTALPWIT